MKHYKIYTTDEQQRQIIKLLETEKSYDEVLQEYGKCEELLDDEVEALRRAGIEKIDDKIFTIKTRS